VVVTVAPAPAGRLPR